MVDIGFVDKFKTKVTAVATDAYLSQHGTTKDTFENPGGKTEEEIEKIKSDIRNGKEKPER